MHYPDIRRCISKTDFHSLEECLEDGPLVVGNVEEHNTYDLSTVWPTKNGIRADVSRRGQDKGPQAVVKIIKPEEYKDMDMPVPSIKY
ncbi:hypothetical protein TURU_156994 [Turdus rufiventris]|nr:hypothetical protein TURU_156994 [Turdus rufiventris]